jgi:peptidoglycan hydrolase-like protein with peptidoglycan-binding domain
VTADRLGTNFPTDSAVALWEREFQGIPTLMAVTLLEAAERAGFGQSRELLRRAERYMNDSAMPASGWTARTNALAARFAAQEGRRADATVRRHEVVRVCEELDNRSLLEQLITLEPQTEVALRAAAAPSLQIELHDFGAIAEIRCTAPNGRQLEFSSPVPRPLIRRGGGNYSTDALKMWATEPRRLAGLLADLIDFHRVGALIEDLGMPTDLALVLPRGPWAALPVEGAMDARGLHSGPLLYRTDPSALGLNAAVAWAQSALSELLGLKVIPDGIFGTMTEQAVEQYQRGNGLVATGLLDATTRRHLRNSLAKARGRSGLPRVLILQRSREGERFSKESYGAIGLAVADLYEECNVPALAIEPPYPHELVKAIEHFEPEIIHIVGGFRESTDVGEVHLFLDDPSAYTKSGRQFAISSSMLASMLRGPASRPRPTVILETPAPPDDFAAALQLFLRNIFAADLFARGVTEAVLATGLCRDVRSLGFTLVSEVSRGASVGRLTRVLRHLAETTGDRFVPTALWATDPEHLTV